MHSTDIRGPDISPAEVKKDTISPIYRIFLYFELIVIITFVPLISAQIFMSFSFFSFINQQVNLYHYFLVNTRLTPEGYPADFVNTPKDLSSTYTDQYISNCDYDYRFNNFLILKKIMNTYPIEETAEVRIQDPDFKNRTLDPVARNIKFYKFDISRVNPDPSTYKTIILSTGICFIEWKGKRYCQKKIYLDSQAKLLQIIDGKKSCQREYPAYIAEDCGTYFNNTYKICALRNFASDNHKVPYLNNITKLQGPENICPVTSLEWLDNNDPSLTQLIPTIRNEISVITGKKLDLYLISSVDMVTFQNYKRNVPANYDISKYYGGTYMYLSNNYSFGMMDDNNIVVDDDYFMNFYKSTDDFIYYPKYLNSSTGNEFYRMFDSTNSVRAQMGIYVVRAISPECFKGYYAASSITDYFGPANKLDVSDYFMFSLTILIWTLASIFFGIYNQFTIRFRIIRMKLENVLNQNNKKAEEITKFTSVMIWFIIFMVKFSIVSIMIGNVTSQVKIVEQMTLYKCYINSVLDIFAVFGNFLVESNTKLYLLLVFLLIELLIQSCVYIGYICIWRENTKKEIEQKRIMSRLLKNL